MCYVIFLFIFWTQIQVVNLSGSLESFMFCSSAHLEQALVEGNRVLQQIDIRQIEKNATKAAINRYKFDLGFYSSLSEKWTDGIARHPVYIYSMVRDLYTLRTLGNTIPNKIGIKDLPTIRDFKGTVSALIRLQYTYNLSTEDMATGSVAGERSVELSPEDCMVIGIQAITDNKLEQAIDWLNYVLSLKSTKTKELLKKIYSLRCKCEYQLGMRNEALASADEWLRIDTDNKEAKEMKEKIVTMQNHGKHVPYNQDLQNYLNLCRGEPTKESKNIRKMSRMYCRFHDNKRHPLLILQPAREEDVHTDPHMKVYRDVLSESEMWTIRELTMSKAANNLRFTLKSQKTAAIV